MEFEKALKAWLERAQQIIVKDHAGRGYTHPVTQLSIDPRGKKYIRIIAKASYETYGSVHCFIEKATGNVLLPAGWKGPAKGARGNIFVPGQEGVGAYGAHYLR